MNHNFSLFALLMSIMVRVNGGMKCFAPMTCVVDRTSQVQWMQVYPPRCESTQNVTTLKGEMGPPGPAGPAGERGPPGTVNTTVMDDLRKEIAILENNMRLLMTKMTSETGRFDVLEQDMNKVMTALRRVSSNLNSEIQTLRGLHNESVDVNAKLTTGLEQMKDELKNLRNMAISQASSINEIVTDVDNARIDIESMRNHHNDSVILLRKEISALRDELTTRLIFPDLCQVVFLSKCFWANATDDRDAMDARRLCGLNGGHAANIYSKEHYDRIRRYLATVAPDDHDYFTGMNYDIKTKRVLLVDGSPAPYSRWYPLFPKNLHGYTAIAFASNIDEAKAGFSNWPPTYTTRQGVLCEMDI